ncbi:MAG: LysR family transcriptional regulator [Phenylobacterium sp.]|uniref:LysR substrate-binding domain-containing protein n=1 Tax=unclassified Phenylobacterium TaxID=2640670 RepID=UPI000B1DDEA6|nr:MULTISPECIES: LysR substrate-binding domain-containing protein [unclassified Phenylobacterium]TAJ69382.1 MAG: LysR family transcriptional regulator [Phenylobacterium sp.]
MRDADKRPGALTLVGARRETPLDDRRAVPPFAALRAFEAVGRLRGIRGAAQALSIDHTVVSRHVRSLESWLGVPLLDRLRGGSQLTDDGRVYHARISRAINEIAESTAELIRRGNDNLLSISCVPGFASEWLAGRLITFQDQHPDIELELQPTDQQPNFTARGTDVDIRFVPDPAPAPDPFLKTFEIARPPVLALASPSLADTLESIAAPEDFLKAPLLHEESADQWIAWLGRQGVDVPSGLPGPRLWHAHIALEAARSGRGVVLANPFLLRDDLQAGRLVVVGPQSSRETILGAYVLTCRADRGNAPLVASFRRWLQCAIECHSQAQSPGVRAAS